MEERMISVSFRKSNRSNFIVCQVSVNGETEGMQYCTSPLKALRYCFLLKKTVGRKDCPGNHRLPPSDASDAESPRHSVRVFRFCRTS